MFMLTPVSGRDLIMPTREGKMVDGIIIPSLRLYTDSLFSSPDAP